MVERRTRMHAQADFLAQPGIDVADVTLLLLVDRAMVDLVNEAAAFTLIGDNLDRPDAAKYGTHSDGSPRYAPEWYVVQSVVTGIHEGIYSRLKELLSCEERDERGHWCAGSLFHDSDHWDGNGCNWPRLGARNV